MSSGPRVGVLALQGAFEAHRAMLTRLGADPVLVRAPEQLRSLDGLILPGGESSTFLRHLERDSMYAALDRFVRQRPTFGTCAGAILLAREVSNPAQPSLGVLDINVERNSYGRQIHSTILHAGSSLSGPPLEMVFIRAPRIARIGPEVWVLARRGDDPVLVEQGHLLAATFHPELSHDDRVHRYFLDRLAVHRAGTADAVQAALA